MAEKLFVLFFLNFMLQECNWFIKKWEGGMSQLWQRLTFPLN